MIGTQHSTQFILTQSTINAAKSQERNAVFDDRPPPINSTEKDVRMNNHVTLVQLRLGYCGLPASYRSMFKKVVRLNICTDSRNVPHDVKHLFIFPAHPMTQHRQICGADQRIRFLNARDPDEHGLKGEQQKFKTIDIYLFCMSNLVLW